MMHIVDSSVGESDSLSNDLLEPDFPAHGVLYNTIVKHILRGDNAHVELHPALTSWIHGVGEPWAGMLQSFAFVCRVSSPGGSSWYASYSPQAHDEPQPWKEDGAVVLRVMPERNEGSRAQPVADILRRIWHKMQQASRDRWQWNKIDSHEAALGNTVLDLALEVLESNMETHWDHHQAFLGAISGRIGSDSRRRRKFGRSLRSPEANGRDQEPTACILEPQEKPQELDGDDEREWWHELETGSDEEELGLWTDNMRYCYDTIDDRLDLYRRFGQFSASLAKIRNLLAKT
ncbi:hypothetical protein EIP91_002696 [Steccherinum ochraceum]|uniref:Uncharacterized protein n=1 Tax=Steccherinum ochraceum TaxID=92696 RepID=A0A4R0RBP1_9APHY|nr:hypothetical protein EIP91_002696 [Steccherinum ochraceum]